MKEGAVVLLALTQADGKVKRRPAVALRQLPGFGDWLVCGVSTQLHPAVAGFDEPVSSSDPDFRLSGFTQPSLIRLGSSNRSPSPPSWVASVPFRRNDTSGCSQTWCVF